MQRPKLSIFPYINLIVSCLLSSFHRASFTTDRKVRKLGPSVRLFVEFASKGRALLVSSHATISHATLREALRDIECAGKLLSSSSAIFPVVFHIVPKLT